MKLYMLCDMEGASGIMSTKYMAERYEEGRKLLTKDISTTAEAVLAAGVDELVVCDCHSGGDNVIWEEMLCDERITYETIATGRLMPSLTSEFDGVILMGHHAKAGTHNAFIPHTMNGSTFEVSINGQSVGEIGIETCYAGAFGVPLVMVQGDEACCAEAREQFPGVITACVKRPLSTSRAAGPHPAIARQRTAEKAAEAVAVARERRLSPYRPELPIRVRVTGTSPTVVEGICADPNITRIDARTYEVTLDDQEDIWRWNRW